MRKFPILFSGERSMRKIILSRFFVTMALSMFLLFVACSDAETSKQIQPRINNANNVSNKYSAADSLFSLDSDQSICTFVRSQFETNLLKPIFLKRKFAKNGVFEIAIPPHIRNLRVRKIIIQSVEGTLSNAYLELDTGKKAKDTIELMNTINVISSKYNIYILTNISTKRIRKDAIIYKIGKDKFVFECKM